MGLNGCDGDDRSRERVLMGHVGVDRFIPPDMMNKSEALCENNNE
jgi:hypothetical protein